MAETRLPQTQRQRRSNSSTAADKTAMSSPPRLATIAPTEKLLRLEQLEPWQRENQHILSGYRPQSISHAKSMGTVFAIHNETVNIHTHLWGMVVLSLLCIAVFFRFVRDRHLAAASWSDVLAMGAFFVSAAFCLGMSATCHALANHSAHVSDLGTKLDLFGIVCLIWGSMVSIIYYGWYCERTIKIAYCTMITLFGAVCAYLSASPKVRTPRWRTIRALMFVSLGLSAIIPTIHGVFLFGLDTVNTRIAFVPWLLTEGLMYILGAVVYVTRFPERFNPGRFDIWGASHQLFHALVLLGTAAHFMALMHSLEYNFTSERC